MGYLFEPDALRAEALEVIGRPLEALVPALVERLAARWPGHIRTDAEWLFNNAGGAMGQMLVLHASITEYVIIFGSPIGTEGHSGRFRADDYFIILEGEQWAYGEGQLARSVFRPGDMHHLPRGTARGYRMPDRCFALEYARGIIPLMLPFGLADVLSSTLDFATLARTFGVYGRAAIAELKQGKI
jgi:C-8 sterol isomerase